MKKWLTITIIGILVALGAATAVLWPRVQARLQDQAIEREQSQIAAQFELERDTAPKEAAEAEVPVSVPDIVPDIPGSTWSDVVPRERVNIDMQFIPQGPLDPGPAHWDIHAESCEEAASLMVHNYTSGRIVTMQQAEQDIFDLIDWQKGYFGGEYDIDADQVATMLEGYFGHTDVEVVRDVTETQLKQLLSAGLPVIAPTIAKYLHNPRYTDQDYHMIVIKGYTPDRFIAHDNGTTWGADYPYPYADLLQAIQATGGDVVVIHS